VQNLEREGGNNRVVVEDDLHLDQSNGLRALQDELRELCPARSLPKLALNGVGGSSCGLLFRLLDPGGTLVTYGGMSRKPVTVSTAQLIFDDIRVRGYWQSRWMSEASHGSKLRLVNDLVDLVLDHGLKCPPVRVFDLKDYRQALEFEAEQSSQAVRSKVVFNCQ
jgi:trans-2-enoyl-CoA reductase